MPAVPTPASIVRAAHDLEIPVPLVGPWFRCLLAGIARRHERTNFAFGLPAPKWTGTHPTYPAGWSHLPSNRAQTQVFIEIALLHGTVAGADPDTANQPPDWLCCRAHWNPPVA